MLAALHPRSRARAYPRLISRIICCVCAVEMRAYHQRSKAMAGRMMNTPSEATSTVDCGSAGDSGVGDSRSSVAEGHEPLPPVVRQAVAPSLLGAGARRGARGGANGGGNGSGGAAAIPSACPAAAPVDDLDAPLAFDAAAVDRLAARLDALAPSAQCAILRPAPPPPASPRQLMTRAHARAGGVAYDAAPDAAADAASGSAVVGSTGGGSAGAGAHRPPQFVFGDLNRPGAFVRPRPRKGGSQVPADCQCCA